MYRKCSEENDEPIKKILDLKFATDVLFFKHFERSFELPSGLNFTHMKTLLTLNFHGPCSMSELSHLMILEKGSFTPVAAKLIEKGFIRKERSSDDKRVYKLARTETGCELAERFAAAHESYIYSVLDRLTEQEQNEYYRLVEDLNRINLKLKKAEGLD